MQKNAHKKSGCYMNFGRTKKVKSDRSIIIKANDDIARKICHLRDIYCQKSGKTTRLQWCHYYSRSHLRVRWDEDNYCLLNSGIHIFWAHKEPDQFKEFWIRRIGQERFEKLSLKKSYAAPVKNQDLLLWNYELKNRLKELENGKSGN